MPRRTNRAILGRKLGMSEMFDESGTWVPVTLIEAGPCTVLQIKTQETDGYRALQVGFDDTRKRVKKPQEGLYKQLETAPKRFVREIPFPEDLEVKAGERLDVSLLGETKQVDISGISKGRGFSGNVRRWNHKIGPKSHGSKSKRVIGSVGMHQDPGRIIKGKRMPGQYGAEKVKVRNLDVMSVDPEQNLLVIKGSVPGPRGGYLYIEESL